MVALEVMQISCVLCCQGCWIVMKGKSPLLCVFSGLGQTFVRGPTAQYFDSKLLMTCQIWIYPPWITPYRSTWGILASAVIAFSKCLMYGHLSLDYDSSRNSKWGLFMNCSTCSWNSKERGKEGRKGGREANQSLSIFKLPLWFTWTCILWWPERESGMCNDRCVI